MPFEEWVVGHARVAKRPHKSAKLEDTLAFFHQLSTLVSSGTPLLQAMKIASTQSESLKLRTVLEQITAKVAAGSTFHTAAAAYPEIFEFQWIEAIRTGEVTGKMALVLVELNKQIRDARETKRKVKASLMYPCILICVAVIAVTVMLWMVVPTFAKMFNDMGAKLPTITQYVVDASDFIVAYGLYILVAVVIIVVAFKKFMKTESGRRYVGGTLMVLPSVGELMVQLAMYKFASNLALLLKSGVPMLETINTVKGIFQNDPLYRDALERVSAGSRRARPFTSHSRRPGCFCQC